MMMMLLSLVKFLLLMATVPLLLMGTTAPSIIVHAGSAAVLADNHEPRWTGMAATGTKTTNKDTITILPPIIRPSSPYKGTIIDPDLLPPHPANIGSKKNVPTSVENDPLSSAVLSSSNINVTQLDCGMRQLALDYAKRLLTAASSSSSSSSSSRNHNLDPGDAAGETLRHVYDALQLEALCNVVPPPIIITSSSGNSNNDDQTTTTNRRTRSSEDSDRENLIDCTYPVHCLHVVADGDAGKAFYVSRIENKSTGIVTGGGVGGGSYSSTATSSSLRTTLQNSTVNRTTDGNDDQPPAHHEPFFTSIHEAVQFAREFRQNIMMMATTDHDDQQHQTPLPIASNSIKIMLGPGVHELQGKTLNLSPDDDGLTIVGYPNEQVWLSGGLAVQNVDFSPRSDDDDDGVYVGNLTTLLEGHELPNILSLFTTTRRWTRARYPNADPERDQWGYASRKRLEYSIPAQMVVEWHLPPRGSPPNFTWIDFQDSSPEGVPRKNDSTMRGYNWYASGSGGVCSDVWGVEADSYWCSNASQGGWAEVDQECATTGQIQLPIGLTYNTSSSSALRRFQKARLEGGILHAWHSQSWAMHMFEITQHMPTTGVIQLAKGGGRQGGRNWCRCDQCTYAAGWCGQHQTPTPWHDTRLISGSWMIENVLAELDQVGEYYFDRDTKLLYIKPNSTYDLTEDLRVGLLEQILDLTGTSNITIENVGFRDTVPTYHPDSDWSAPSGGDWSLHRGGAIFLENVTDVTIRGCTFRRLDGNAVFLSRRNRNVTIEENHFEWLGENAIATWGDTDGYDATAEDFPMYTTIQRNVMRELGIFEKQSSAVGQAKAAHTYIRDNIMFNMPRAAINFNDMVGGGDTVQGNLIFNTCRESGDHGPINSWDRQPFLTTLRDGKTKSFEPVPREISSNFIIANYGASQGVDNDDGSSWFHIHHNLFYSAEGFKMDYGGHDSVFEDNLIMAFPYDGSQCFSMGSFYQGHGDVLRNNRCLVGLGHHMDSGCGDPSCASPIPETDASQQIVGHLWGGCETSAVVLSHNQYFTPDGNAKIGCQDDAIPLEEMETKYGMEDGSTHSKLPDEETMIKWAKQLLSM